VLDDGLTLAHAPERLHEEIAADYSDMICAATRRLKHRAVSDSLEEAGDRLFTFSSARATHRLS